MKIVCVVVLVCMFGCGRADPPPPSVDLSSSDPPAKKLQQAEYFYEMVKQSKPEDYLEWCFKAGTAAAAALLADDGIAYEKWSAIKDEDCKKSGLRK